MQRLGTRQYIALAVLACFVSVQLYEAWDEKQEAEEFRQEGESIDQAALTAAVMIVAIGRKCVEYFDSVTACTNYKGDDPVKQTVASVAQPLQPERHKFLDMCQRHKSLSECEQTLRLALLMKLDP